MINIKYKINVTDEHLKSIILGIMRDDTYTDKDAAYHMIIHRPLMATYDKSDSGRLVHRQGRRDYCRGFYDGVKLSFDSIK